MKMKQVFIVIATCIVSIAAGAQAPLVKDLGYRGGSIAGIGRSNALHFILMGDWGP